MKGDREDVAKLLEMPVGEVEIDRFAYTRAFPNEVKAWKFIAKNHPALRRYQNRLYYPPTAQISLLDLTTELLFRLRFEYLNAIPALIANDVRFRNPVMPETELLVQVKLLRNYKGRIGMFSGVIVDRNGDIVAENISKGTIIKI
jgi:3-hydroxymyristoyl/3-hydroxydecanoyl-(acyl carrier protein) dehydratase